MRTVIPLALAAAALASCAPTPPGQAAIAQAQAQARLGRLLAGKVAGPPQSCLASYRQNDMVVIDDYTIAYRDGANRVYVNHPPGGCNLLGAGNYTLVTRTTGSELCRGDIGQVVDLMNHATVGSCAMGDFIPYERPRH